MVKFESSVRHIQASQSAVYKQLSDLRNLEKIKERLPADKVKTLSFDADSLTIDASPMGQVTLKIVEQEPCKCIKFSAVTSPVPFSLWIQLLPVEENECKMKLTVGLEINAFMKAMIQKPLQDGLEKMADSLASIHYTEN